MKPLLKIAVLIIPYWKIAMLGPLLMIIEVSMDLLQPRLIQHIIDDGIAQLDTSLIVNTSMVMIILSLLGLLGGFGGGFFAVRASQLFGAALRSQLFRKVQSLSFADLDRIGTGDIITRLTNDVTQLQQTLMICLHILVRTPLIIIGSIVMATMTSPSLAMMFFVLTPLVMLIMTFVIRRTYHTFSQVQKRVDQLNTVMLENFAGIRVVKAFVRANYEKKRFQFRNQLLKEEMVRGLQIAAISLPATMFILNLGVVAVIWFGGLQVNQGLMTVGEIIAFINYITYLMFSVMMVGMLLTRVSRAAASAQRLMDILEVAPSPPLASTKIPCIKGHLQFKDVSFNYRHSTDPVLNAVSFEATPGQMIAILGATGAGKSSLVHLIPRFYECSAGQISIDGVDIQQIPEATLHQHIAIAMQDIILFSGTIRDNITYGRHDASDEEMIKAAKIAQAHAFISAFPDGYETQLGQRGVNLSGGQKQRISIARALLTQPTILILDDSTSAIDVDTESRLQCALFDLMQHCTSIIIAQRISTVLTADNIIVLDNGHVVAQGTHQELLATIPIYGEIYTSQLGNEALIHES